MPEGRYFLYKITVYCDVKLDIQQITVASQPTGPLPLLRVERTPTTQVSVIPAVTKDTSNNFRPP